MLMVVAHSQTVQCLCKATSDPQDDSNQASEGVVERDAHQDPSTTASTVRT